MAEDNPRPEAIGPWLDTPEAAAYLRMSAASLRTFRCDGRGPRYHKAGRSVRYHRDDLDAYVRGAREPP